MASEWNTYSLDEVINIIGGGTPKRSVPDYWGGTLPWLSVKDFNTSSRYVSKAEEYITELGLAKSSTKVLDKGQIIISARGTVGELAQLKVPMAFNQSCYGIDAKKDIVLNDYLYYLLTQKVRELKSIAHGSVFDTITRDTFQNIKVSLPSIDEQKTIAHILGTLDDKIELNRQMNETLETMAQALFKSWFVDFDPVIDNALAAGSEIPEPLQKRAAARQALGDQRKPLPANIQSLFPDSFVFTDEMGWIPEGWAIKTIDDVTESVFSGGTPNTKTHEYWNGALNWFSSGETREFVVIDTEKTITPLGAKESSTKLAVPGDTLIAGAGQGHTRGQTTYCSIETYVNQSVVTVRPLMKRQRLWLFMNLYSRYQEMRAISDSHSSRGSLTTKLVKDMKVIRPSERILDAYEDFASTTMNKIVGSLQNSDVLSSLRDTLLPKLLSGELRIPDAEKQVAEAV